MEEIIRLQRATVDEHIGQENAHNWPAVYDTFAPHESAIDVVPFHTRFGGLNGISDFYQAVDAAFPEIFRRISPTERVFRARPRTGFMGFNQRNGKVLDHVKVPFFMDGAERGRLGDEIDRDQTVNSFASHLFLCIPQFPSTRGRPGRPRPSMGSGQSPFF
jgi:hypothetical protein